MRSLENWVKYTLFAVFNSCTTSYVLGLEIFILLIRNINYYLMIYYRVLKRCNYALLSKYNKITICYKLFTPLYYIIFILFYYTNYSIYENICIHYIYTNILITFIL